jgi:hypothetical protein
MKTKTIILFFTLTTILFDAQVVRSQAPTNRRSKYWNAQWISSPGTSQRDEIVLHFKKVIELSERPQHFYVDVSADNQFVFHVNHQRAGNGPSRADLAHWRYETYDLAPTEMWNVWQTPARAGVWRRKKASIPYGRR